MLRKQLFVICSLVLVGFLFTSQHAKAGSAGDFDGKLAKINKAGFVLMASVNGEFQVVGNARQFETLSSSDKPPTFYLMYKKTGKKYQVKIDYGSKKHPGEYVWEFYIWLVKTVGEE